MVVNCDQLCFSFITSKNIFESILKTRIKFLVVARMIGKLVLFIMAGNFNLFLKAEVSVLSPRVAFLDHQRLLLNVDNSALKQRIAALAQDKIFKDGT